jgi:hypothetical protein
LILLANFGRDSVFCKSAYSKTQIQQINWAVRMSPAMATRLFDRLWDYGDIVNLIDNEKNQTQDIAGATA